MKRSKRRFADGVRERVIGKNDLCRERDFIAAAFSVEESGKITVGEKTTRSARRGCDGMN
jgi:hypothetical protein